MCRQHALDDIFTAEALSHSTGAVKGMTRIWGGYPLRRELLLLAAKFERGGDYPDPVQPLLHARADAEMFIADLWE